MISAFDTTTSRAVEPEASVFSADKAEPPQILGRLVPRRPDHLGILPLAIGSPPSHECPLTGVKLLVNTLISGTLHDSYTFSHAATDVRAQRKLKDSDVVVLVVDNNHASVTFGYSYGFRYLLKD